MPYTQPKTSNLKPKTLKSYLCRMHKATINGQEFKIESKSGKETLNGKPFVADIVALGKGRLHVIRNHKSYTAEIVEVNREEKVVTIKINHNTYKVSVIDQYDELLQKLGMEKGASKQAGDIKAPMPGMVLNVMVENGAPIKKGDALVTLEAMKMENIIKASADGFVKKIIVKKGDKVEKNQVMISIQ